MASPSASSATHHPRYQQVVNHKHIKHRNECLCKLCRHDSCHWSRVEVCTGSKLKPEPGPYPRLSDLTRPDPSGTVKFRARTRPEIPPPPPPQRIANKKKKRKKPAFHDFTFAISQTFTSYESLWTSGAAVAYILPSLWILYGQEDNFSTVQIMVIFLSVKAR